MTGSVAIDVVIGLIFIYLLYSLFATVIMEIANTIFGLRARNLRYALRRMLMNEDKVENRFFRLGTELVNTFLKMSGFAFKLSDPGLFNTFYNQPSIKYLSAGGIANKPSYISPHNFSKTIIDSIASNFSIEGVIRSIYADLETLEKIFGSLSDSSEIKKDFNKRENKNSSFKEWYKSIECSKQIIYAAILVPSSNHSLKKQVHFFLAEDGSFIEPLPGGNPVQKIKAGISLLPDTDTKKHLESLLVDAQNDLEKFKFYLEQWFDDTMERATGWFKRRAQCFLFIIGFVLAISFNANTFDIVKKLSDNPEAREQLVKLAIEYSKENKEFNKNSSAEDTIAVYQNNHITKVNDSLQKIANRLQADIYKAQNIIAVNWLIPDSIRIFTSGNEIPNVPFGYVKHKYQIEVLDTSSKNDKKDVQKDTVLVWSLLHESIELESFDKAIPPTYSTTFNESQIDVDQSTYKWSYGLKSKNLWGYILTALAISLGSPFWFDLLNKLINLRNSIQPRKQDKQGSGNTGRAALIKRVG